MRKWLTGCALAGVAVMASSSIAGAQNQPDRTPPHRHAGPLHVDVAPVGRLYRACIDHPVVEHRASGDTVVPSFSCRWAVR